MATVSERTRTIPELPPLDDQDHDDAGLVGRIQSGDERALETLIQRYRDLARWKARHYYLPGGDEDDLVQEAMIGLFKAIRDFDPGKEIPFRAFAAMCITRHILTAMRGATRSKHDVLSRSVSLELPLSRDGTQGSDRRSVGDSLRASHLDDPADAVIVAEEIEALRDSIKDKLSEMEVEIFSLHLAGNTYKDIGTSLGFHTKAIDNALQRIRKKVRIHMQQRENEEAAADRQETRPRAPSR